MNVDENEVPEVVFRTPLYGKAGKELSLYGLVTEDPEWACNRMVMGNHIIQKRDEEIKLLRESLAAKERECEGLRNRAREISEDYVPRHESEVALALDEMRTAIAALAEGEVNHA